MPHLCGVSGLRKQVCGGCGEDCLYDGIFCDSCAAWRHVACERLSVKEVQAFKDLPLDFPYICTTCRCDSRGSFNFEESLNRLHRAARYDYEKLEASVARESLFIKPKSSFPRVKVAELKLDVHTQALFEKYVRDSKNSKNTPVKTTADGNSLFSAVSVALVAKEKLATELRVRCCLEMVNYAAYYQWQKNHEALCLCAPDYIDSCLNCATPGEDSCVWTMSALASVISLPIKSIYPGVNGQSDGAMVTLNTIFYPREKGEDVGGENMVRIMWSNKKAPSMAPQPGSWIPDHFAPLVEIPAVKMSPLMGSVLPSRVSGRKRKPTAKLLDAFKSSAGSALRMEVGVEEEEEETEDQSEMYKPVAEEKAPTRKWKRRRTEPEIQLDPDWQNKYTHDAVGGHPLGSSFLLIKEIFDIITNAKEPLPSIPRGRKNNVYFVVDNSKNVRHPYRRNYFMDDCGLYHQRSGTTCKSWYLYQDGSVFALNKVDGKYCKETKQNTRLVKGKKVKQTRWIPMDPQPDENSLMLVNRFYTTLQCDPTYRRRISWFSVLPPSIKTGHEVMVVEYLNKAPNDTSMDASYINMDTHGASDVTADGDDTVEMESSAVLDTSCEEAEAKADESEVKTSEISTETDDSGKEADATETETVNAPESGETENEISEGKDQACGTDDQEIQTQTVEETEITERKGVGTRRTQQQKIK